MNDETTHDNETQMNTNEFGRETCDFTWKCTVLGERVSNKWKRDEDREILLLVDAAGPGFVTNNGIERWVLYLTGSIRRLPG